MNVFLLSVHSSSSWKSALDILQVLQTSVLWITLMYRISVNRVFLFFSLNSTTIYEVGKGDATSPR